MESRIIIRTLSVIIIILLGCGFFGLDKALYYRDNPRIQIEKHTNVIYGKFDPNRDQAYTCVTQKVIDNVGMVCSSPEGDITINCTVGAGDINPSQYFC
jgi:hypothetical protein